MLDLATTGRQGMRENEKALRKNVGRHRPYYLADRRTLRALLVEGCADPVA